NSSVAGSEGGGGGESVIIPLVYLGGGVVGTVGNSLVLGGGLRNGQVKNTTGGGILNLGVADLCFILFCVPFQATIYTGGGWVFGPFMCKAGGGFIYLTMYASSWGGATVSLDRYLAIRYPLRGGELRTPRNALMAGGGIWGLSFIFSGPYLSYYQEFQLANRGGGHPIWEISQRKGGGICTFVFSYIIGGGILSLTYVRTIRGGGKSMDPLQDMSGGGKAKRKVTRMIGGGAVLFCLCWLPRGGVILCVWFGYFPGGGSTYVLRILSHGGGYANSCVNPIVWGGVSKHFRKGFKKGGGCLLHKKAIHRGGGAQVTNTVSMLGGGVSEVTQLSEALPGRSSACCRVPAQPRREVELVGQQQKADGSFITFSVS
ncbi:GALR2 protein, partial [Onychorhynchus coronatus]|nr:GALR2 protein [Onychorhynchus coronatus]